MRSETRWQQSSAFPSFFLDRSMLRQISSRALVTSSIRDLENTFLGISRKTVSEVSRISAQLEEPEIVLSTERDAALKRILHCSEQ